MSNMANKIIVIGGSFNPPTIAHLKLMQSAIAQLSTVDSFEDMKRNDCEMFVSLLL